MNLSDLNQDGAAEGSASLCSAEHGREFQRRPLRSGLPTLGGGGVPFCLVGPLFKISFFPTRKVFKILGGWGSEIPPPRFPLVSKGLFQRTLLAAAAAERCLVADALCCLAV